MAAPPHSGDDSAIRPTHLSVDFFVLLVPNSSIFLVAMSRIPAFWGNGEGEIEAEKFLEAIDEVMAIRDNDWDRVAEFESKLGGVAHDWFNALPKSLRSVWSILRGLFVAYFIECIGNDAFRSKCSKMLSTPSIIALITEVSNQSTSSPVYHILVEELDDPAEVFHTALQELQSTTDIEKIFRVLWDAARMIGSNNCTCGNEFNRGFGMGKSAGIQEGKRIGLEQAMKRSMVNASVDTSDLPKMQISTSTDTSDLSPVIPIIVTPSDSIESTSTSLASWAEEANLLPAATLIPSSTPVVPAACDIAALHLESPVPPFRSLQQRSRRLHRSRRRGSRQQQGSSNSFHTTPMSILPQPHSFRNSPLITRCHPKGIGPGKPVEIFHVSAASPVPVSTPASHAPTSSWIPKPVLDWVGDPRLAQLGQLLGELGWVRQFR